MKTPRFDIHSDCYAQDAIEYSVYSGRVRLGRLVRSGEREYQAFDRDDKALGTFRKQKQALHAIYAAAGAYQ